MVVAKIYPRGWLWPGLELRGSADRSSPVLLRVKELACVPIWSSRPGWVEVTLRGIRGWVETRAVSGRVSRIRRPNAAPPAALFAQAREAVGLSEPVGEIGSFDLYTHLRDRSLLDLLAGGGSALEAAYAERYGLALNPRRPRSAIVLFTSRRDFLRLHSTRPQAGLEAPSAFASGGLVVGHTGLQVQQEVLVALLHEMTHVLNRRALPVLPSWLEEGIATDLGLFWYEDPDAPASGWFVGREGEQRLQSTYQVLHGIERPTLPLEALLSANRAAFFDRDAQSHYAQSVFFIRFLLDGEGGVLARPFREYLAAVAAGESPAPGKLLEFLGRDWEQLEEGYGKFLGELEAERAQKTARSPATPR